MVSFPQVYIAEFQRSKLSMMIRFVILSIIREDELNNKVIFNCKLMLEWKPDHRENRTISYLTTQDPHGVLKESIPR